MQRSRDLRQRFEHHIAAMAVRDNVTTPPLIAQFEHIVSQLGCSPRARDPTIFARPPLENRIALHAVCPASGGGASLLQRCVKLGNKWSASWPTIVRLVPAAFHPIVLRKRAVHDNHGFLRLFAHRCTQRNGTNQNERSISRGALICIKSLVCSASQLPPLAFFLGP